MGSLSDRFGRRPVLLTSLMAFAVDYLVLALAPTVAWLFVGRIIAGVTGASISTAMAYISDVSTPENKAKNFGLVGAAFGIGLSFVLWSGAWWDNSVPGGQFFRRLVCGLWILFSDIFAFRDY